MVEALLVAACGGSAGAPGPARLGNPIAGGAGEPPAVRAIASTSIVADVVAAVGGSSVAVTSLVPRNADPHAFEPSPEDAAEVADADVLFVSGLGLDAFASRLATGAGGRAPVEVELSSGLDGVGGTGTPMADPHVWFDPQNVAAWTERIAGALASIDPDHAPRYKDNAAAYRRRLAELDAAIGKRVSRVPEEQRLLVTDHTFLTHFARRYGFRQVGAVNPGVDTLAEASAGELAALEDEIIGLDIGVLFIGEAMPSAVAARVADDTGARVVRLFTGSLGEAGGPAGTYLDLMGYNSAAIVGALGPGSGD